MDREELSLWTRFKAGDQQARKQLILRYFPLVNIWASGICAVVNWANREDLIQEGATGLIDAVDTFDYKRGIPFKGYARKLVRGAMFDNQEVRRYMSRRMHELYRLARNVEKKLTQSLQRQPTMEEIALESGLEMDQIMNAFRARALTFSEQFPELDPETSIDIGVNEVKHVKIEDKVFVRQSLSQLNPKHARIVVEHYCFGRTDAEIAGVLNMTEESVKQTRLRAMRKLRSIYESVKRNDDAA